MTYRDYMNDHDTEHFTWCCPYSDETGDYKLVIYDGEINAVSTPDTIAHRYDGTLTDEVLEQFARAVNPYYDDYKGWDNLHIALEVMHEIGCSGCPFNADCEALDEEMSDTDNV